MMDKRKNGLIKLQIIVNYENFFRDLGSATVLLQPALDFYFFKNNYIMKSTLSQPLGLRRTLGKCVYEQSYRSSNPTLSSIYKQLLISY